MSMPCQNNGTCNEQVDRYDCSCVDGYSGAHCETGDIIQIMCYLSPHGMFTLPDTETNTETDKNEHCRSFYTDQKQTQTQIPLGYARILLVAGLFCGQCQCTTNTARYSF